MTIPVSLEHWSLTSHTSNLTKDSGKQHKYLFDIFVVPLLQNLTRRRRYVSSAALGGKLYVMGGYDGHSRLNLVECLDLTQSQLAWNTIAPMHHRRGLAGVCVYKGNDFLLTHAWEHCNLIGYDSDFAEKFVWTRRPWT